MVLTILRRDTPSSVANSTEHYGEPLVDALGKLWVNSGDSYVFKPTVTVSASPDYTSGDTLGGKITLTNIARAAGSGMVLTSLVITDAANQKPEGEILVFDANPADSTLTDNAAFVLHADDIELDPSTRRVTRNGEQVPLTLKEFGLLEYFMRNPDKVVSREDLLNHLWDFNYVGFSNVVDVHIKNLRRKLSGDSEGLLETIRGIGYRLRA